MLRLKQLCIAAFGLAALTSSLPAWSVPVTAGSPTIFNFISPTAGPFVVASIAYGIAPCTVFENNVYNGCTGTDAPDDGNIEIFDGLDGSSFSGGVIGHWDDNSLGLGTYRSFAGLADGVFSLVYTATIGAIDAAPFADLIDARGGVTRVNGVAGATAVPEPGSIALLGIGSLAVSAGMGRRRRATRVGAIVS